MDESAKEYIAMAKEIARSIWGEEAEKMSQQIEATASAAWRIWQTELSPMREPATRLRHREQK